MNRKNNILALAIMMSLPLTSMAAEDWLVISNSTLINTGQKLSLEIVKPDNTPWPDTLRLELSGAGISEEAVLVSHDANENTSANRRSYSLTPSKKYVGVVKARLADVESNQFLLLASTDDTGPVTALLEPGPASTTDSGTPAVTEPPVNSSPQIVIAKPGDEPALSAHEPTYFVVGDSSDRGADARFQLSFKYRLFDPEGIFGRFSPLFSNLYFTYTQTSLWDLGEDSSPFRDTSYRPGLFYKWAGSDKFLLPDEWRVGVEHESNGRSDLDSRAIDTAYLIPSWHTDMANGRRFSFMPKIYHYIDKNENRDIQRYRGYVDWVARYGREDGLVLNGLYRQGTGGYATGQLDVSYPISERIFARTGSFVYLQLFSGYGETLLDYDHERDTQIRLGISISR
jgi:phospholipase A1